MEPDGSSPNTRHRRPSRGRTHGELAVVMTVLLLLACWAMLVL